MDISVRLPAHAALRRSCALLVRRAERVKTAMHTRLVPLLSLFAAFSFVIMMFNLPLPGGTTGHAVGIGIAAVVLGPWAAMLAVSIALVIQALFFAMAESRRLARTASNSRSTNGSTVPCASHEQLPPSMWRGRVSRRSR